MEGCGQAMRSDDMVCRGHYRQLPDNLRKLCWKEYTEGNKALILNWLDEHNA
jgi:hypothetical protein